MIDWIETASNQEFKSGFVSRVLAGETDYWYRPSVEGYRYCFYSKEGRKQIDFQPVQLFVKYVRRFKNQLRNRVRMNPSRSGATYADVIKHYAAWFHNFDPHKHHLRRLDFAVDLEREFDEVVRAVFIKHKHNLRTIFNKEGSLVEIVIGDYGFSTKLYNAMDKLNADVTEAKYLTRIEVSLVKRGSTSFPVKTLAELPELIGFNPFESLQFGRLENV